MGALQSDSWPVAAGRDSRPRAPLYLPPLPTSNFILGDRREHSRDDGTPTWEALEPPGALGAELDDA